MSKGVYKKICDWSPDTYGRLCEYIDSELDQYYLDGPNDVDWIFRNAIISSREESIYVDYVEFEPGEHFWLSPQSKDIGDDLFQSSFVPGVIRMIRLLNSTGLFKPKALKEFSKFWQEFRFTEETHHIAFRDANFDFLKILDDKGLLSKMGEDDVARFIDRYPYPLYGKDIKENRVDKEELMDARRRYIENELS